MSSGDAVPYWSYTVNGGASPITFSRYSGGAWSIAALTEALAPGGDTLYYPEDCFKPEASTTPPTAAPSRY